MINYEIKDGWYYSTNMGILYGLPEIKTKDCRHDHVLNRLLSKNFISNGRYIVLL